MRMRYDTFRECLQLIATFHVELLQLDQLYEPFGVAGSDNEAESVKIEGY